MKTNKTLIAVILSWPTMIAIVFAIIVASAPCSRADLIDLTPGGFDETQPFPQVVSNFFNEYGHGMQNLAGALIQNNQPVWSPFTIFGDANFDITMNSAGTGANVGWDLFGTGFRGLFVFVESSALIANLYAIPWTEHFDGTGFAEIDGNIPLLAITFTGTDRAVPDTGHTIVLLAAGLLAIGVYRWSARRT